MGDVLNGEFEFSLSASISFVRTNTEWTNPKPIYVTPKKLILRFGEPLHKQKERTKRFIAEMSSLFLLVMFLLTQK